MKTRPLTFTLWLLSCSFCFYAGKSWVTHEQSTGRFPASVSTMNVVGQTVNVVLGDSEKMSFKAKVDTGAESSSLHATDIKVTKVKEHGQMIPYVRYTAQDDTGVEKKFFRRVSRIDDVKNANGKTIRYYVKEKITFEGETHELDVNLSDRSDMTFKFLLGKNALRAGNHVVDPAVDVIIYENSTPEYVYVAP